MGGVEIKRQPGRPWRAETIGILAGTLLGFFWYAAAALHDVSLLFAPHPGIGNGKPFSLWFFGSSDCGFLNPVWLAGAALLYFWQVAQAYAAWTSGRYGRASVLGMTQVCFVLFFLATWLYGTEVLCGTTAYGTRDTLLAAWEALPGWARFFISFALD